MARINYKKCSVDLNEFEKRKVVQKGNKADFREHIIGSRKNLWVYSSLIATNCNNFNLDIDNTLPNKNFISFLGNFRKNLYNNLNKKPELLDLKIAYTRQSRFKNIELFDSLNVNDIFHNIDLNSAYWQIAHKLGYISKSFFIKYKDQDEYKEAKRYCISFLVRQNKVVYHPYGKPSYQITCDNTIFKNIYDNIRNHLYECVYNSVSDFNNILEFNIDGITVLYKDLDIVRQNFKDMGLEYKTIMCIKENEYQYKHGSKLRNFKHKK